MRMPVHQPFLNTFLVALLIALAPLTHAAAPAGKVIFARGEVQVLDASGEPRTPRRGAELYEKDTIVTGQDGRLQARLADDSMLSVRPDTRVVIQSFRYSEEKPEDGESVMSLVKGGLRAITGAIGKYNKENVKVKTEVGTIGIRGTDHEPMFIPADAAAAYEAEPGLYDKVNDGAVVLQSDAGELVLGENEVGFVGGRDVTPQRLQQVPDFFKQTAASRANKETDGEDEGKEQEGTADSTEEGGDEESSTEEQAEPDTSTETSENDDEVVTNVVAEDEGQEIDLTNQTVTDEDGKTSDFGDVESLDGLGAPVNLATSYGEFFTTIFVGDESEMQTTSDGVVVGWSHDAADYGLLGFSLNNIRSTTVTDAGHAGTTGIRYGMVQADSITETHYSYDTSTPVEETWDLTRSGFHWAQGPGPEPEYLAQVVTGTVQYLPDGGTTPLASDGTAGTLDSASMTVDFTRRAVALDLAVSMAADRWQASATAIPILDSWFHAWACPGCTTEPGALSVTRNGTAQYGSVSGGLTGEGLDGAVVAYNFNGIDADTNALENINGVTAFRAEAAQNTNAPYRFVGHIGAAPFTMPDLNGPLLWRDQATAASRVELDGGGQVKEFDAITLPDTDAARPTHVKRGTVQVVDTGSDPQTGVTWGRWTNGTITLVDRITGARQTLELADQSLHLLTSPEMQGPVELPTSGTASYSFVGGTTPTDNQGGTGTLESAYLTANFDQHTVDVGVQVKVPNAVLTADATGTPISALGGFSAGRPEETPVEVTCSGSNCGSGQSAVMNGGFAGPGGEAAGLLYGIKRDDGTATGNIVSGAAAFRR